MSDGAELRGELPQEENLGEEIEKIDPKKENMEIIFKSLEKSPELIGKILNNGLKPEDLLKLKNEVSDIGSVDALKWLEKNLPGRLEMALRDVNLSMLREMIGVLDTPNQNFCLTFHGPAHNFDQENSVRLWRNEPQNIRDSAPDWSSNKGGIMEADRSDRDMAQQLVSNLISEGNLVKKFKTIKSDFDRKIKCEIYVFEKPKSQE